MSSVLKIALIGPRKGGKTRIANVLLGQPLLSKPGKEYAPTNGVRIIELARDVSHISPDVKSDVNVELWDLSGDQEFEPCWPAVIDGLDGIISVFDSNRDSQASDTQVWVEFFANAGELHTGQAMIMSCDNERKKHKSMKLRLPHGKVSVPVASIPSTTSEATEEQQTNAIEHEFQQFIAGLARNQK